MPVPFYTLSKITETEQVDAVPELWNKTYREIEENVKYIDQKIGSFENGINGKITGMTATNLGQFVNDLYINARNAINRSNSILASVNGKSGNVQLTVSDISGAAPLNNALFTNPKRNPITNAVSFAESNPDQLATLGAVMEIVNTFAPLQYSVTDHSNGSKTLQIPLRNGRLHIHMANLQLNQNGVLIYLCPDDASYAMRIPFGTLDHNGNSALASSGDRTLAVSNGRTSKDIIDIVARSAPTGSLMRVNLVVFSFFY